VTDLRSLLQAANVSWSIRAVVVTQNRIRALFIRTFWNPSIDWRIKSERGWPAGCFVPMEKLV